MAINKNINDDITLAYLLKKVKTDVLSVLNTAVEKIYVALGNKVDKAGDTMTGMLYQKSTNLDIAQTQSVWGSAYHSLTDKNDNRVGVVRAYQNNGFDGIHISGHNGNTENALRLGTKSDGSRNVYVTDPAAWRNALNAVNKDGDTITGHLTLAAGNEMRVRAGFKSNGTYSSNQYAQQYRLDDSEGTCIGLLRSVHYSSSGNETLDLLMWRRVNGANVYNTIQLAIKPDGGLAVYVTDPAAWRSAIGAVNKAGDTLSGTLKYEPSASVTYVQGATGEGAALYVKKRALNANTYNPAVVVQTKGGGSWAINNYNDEKLEFAYVSKANIDSQTNLALVCGIDTNGNYSGNAANVTGTVAIANGGSGQTGLTYVNTIASIITAASGITISAAEYCQWGKVAQLSITWKRSSAITVSADGNIANVTVGTIASGKRPKMLSAGTSHGDDGGPAFYSLATGGSLFLGACEGTGATRTIAANTVFRCWMTYLLP